MRVSSAIVLLIAATAALTVPTARSAYAPTTGPLCQQGVICPVGTLCLVPQNWGACPLQPATVTGAIHEYMGVKVFLQSSDGFDSFDIIINANSSDLGGPSIDPGLATSICWYGSAIPGIPSACGPSDGPGKIHAKYSGATLSAPFTGSLFTINYKVLRGNRTDTIGYLQGCAGSSVTNTTDCVSFTRNTLILAENVIPINAALSYTAGAVCIVPISVNACSQPYSFTGSAGNELKIAIDANITKPINGFDVSIKTDPNVLYPVSIDYNNSLVPPNGNGVFADECINNHLILGPRCTGSDGQGIAHLAAVGPFNWMSSGTVQGLLYIVTYRVLMNVNSTIGFQTGCNSSSVYNTTICVDFADGTATPVPVGIVDPAFSASGPSGSVSLSKTLDLNSFRATSSGNLTLTFDPQNAIVTGIVSVTLTNTTAGSELLTKTFSIALTVPFGSRARFILSLRTTSLALAEVCILDRPAATSASCVLVQNPNFTQNGTVNIIDFGVLAYAFGSSKGMPGYQSTIDLDMNGTIDITDAGIEALYFGVEVIN